MATKKYICQTQFVEMEVKAYKYKSLSKRNKAYFKDYLPEIDGLIATETKLGDEHFLPGFKMPIDDDYSEIIKEIEKIF